MLFTLLFKRWMASLGRRLWNRELPMDSTDGLPPSAPPAASPTPGDELTAKRVAREGLLLYHNLNKLDRWGGGGFGLSALVKLAGWAGLLAIMGALVVKLRTVEQQLDPVSHGVDQLQAELARSRTELAEQSRRDRTELEAARQDAVALREAVRASSAAHTEAGSALSDADRTTRALAERLAAELDKEKQLDARQASVARDLDGFQGSVTTAQASLTTAQSTTAASWTGLGADLQTVRGQAQALGQQVSGVDLKPVQSQLAQVSTDAKALSQSLQKATQDAEVLDRTLQDRLEEERRRAEAEKRAAVAVAAAPPAAH